MAELMRAEASASGSIDARHASSSIRSLMGTSTLCRKLHTPHRITRRAPLAKLLHTTPCTPHKSSFHATLCTPHKSLLHATPCKIYLSCCINVEAVAAHELPCLEVNDLPPSPQLGAGGMRGNGSFRAYVLLLCVGALH